MSIKNLESLKLVLIIFIVIFEPSILPISTYYITLIGAFLYIIYQGKINVRILKKSEIIYYWKAILIMFLMLLISNLVSSLFDNNFGLFENRLRVINQLIILLGGQLIIIYSVLIYVNKRNMTLETLLRYIVYAGALQGVFAIVAFLFPDIRSLFLHYSFILQNDYAFERRGYGFSEVLVDTFGYAMGLIGAILVFEGQYLIKSTIYRIGCYFLIAITILLNSRTGFVVWGIAFLIKWILDFYSKKYIFLILPIILGMIVFAALDLKILIQSMLQVLYESDNSTLSWVASAFLQILESTENNYIGETEYSFFSNIVPLPDNTLSLIIGSGHSVYRTSNILGFATDIGYFNFIWIYGFLGTIFLLLTMMTLFYKSYRYQRVSRNVGSLCITNGILYYIILIKANLLGYNPGTVVMNLIIVLSIYYGKKND